MVTLFQRTLMLCAGVVLTCLIVPSTATAAPIYTVLDLGTLGGTNVQLDGNSTLNASGQVAGLASLPGDTAHHAFRTAPNSPITPSSDLGTLGGTNSVTSGINASGQVAGYASLSSGLDRAFRTAPNSSTISASDNLGTLGGNISNGYGLNDLGQVVGGSRTTGDNASHAFRTAPNAAINPATDDLGTLGGTVSAALGVNNSGQAVGYASLTGNSSSHAFRTAPNGPITANSDLGTLGGSGSQARAINDLGQVVGFASTSTEINHAYRTEPGGKITPATDLGTLGGTASEAYSINSKGQAVGFSFKSGFSNPHAFFIDVTGAMVDLNDLIPAGSGWVLIEARGINDSGQIAGNGTIGGQNHAFLLTPIPEPGGLAFLVAAITILGCRRRAMQGAR